MTILVVGFQIVGLAILSSVGLHAAVDLSPRRRPSRLTRPKNPPDRLDVDVLRAALSHWKHRVISTDNRDRHLLSTQQFNREVARERVRATRRAIPFCLLTVVQDEGQRGRNATRSLARLLHRNLRITDHKGMLGPGTFGVLLVDTPEMGGRAALDRISRLAEEQNLNVRLNLRVHDPEGFDPDHDQRPPRSPERRRDDPVTVGESAAWMTMEEGDVEISSEDPMVPHPFMRMALKRGVDIAGACVGLVLASPLIAGGMMAVKLTDRGPSLFKQTREGYRGRPFTIYKIRTMVVDAEQAQASLREQNHRDGPAFKMAQDPRVTRVGDFLRKTCIDELPQLWNVLMGDMSLVGPRPLPWHESRACQGWHRRRLDVRPGMTCYWQVNKAGAETFDDWMRLDLRYIDELSLFKDLRLIAQTVAVPITGRGGE